jgi:broad specificity phosphatase PhoE
MNLEEQSHPENTGLPISNSQSHANHRRLILVRHSLSKLVRGVPPDEWDLSEEGRQRCIKLADHLREHNLDRIITSTEPKAIETGQIVADILKVPWNRAPNLHEHQRTSIGIIERADFEYHVANLFKNPHKKVFGEETADEARIRFEQAVIDVIEKYDQEKLAIVSHGTVMTLLIASTNPIDPYTFWRGLGLPAIVILSLPDYTLLHTKVEIT